MTPIGKYILVDVLTEEMETSSGLLLSAEDADTFRYKKACVVESGTEVDNIHKGDTIYYDKMSGHTMMIRDIQYTVIREADVVVVE